MPYRIHLRRADAAAFDRLVDLGALDVEADDERGLTALMPDGILPERVARETRARDVSVTPAVGRDEGSVWVLRPRAIRIGRVQIVPAGADAPADAVRLVDEPVFGTGLHPTTALCVEAIDEALQANPIEALLDVGTGSGVLALAALRLGAERALGIDVDEHALHVAAENARLNGLDARLELARGGPESIAGAWPFVVANVLAAPLVEMAPTLVRRVGHHGRLVLSGIADGVETDVDRAYRRLGMRHLETKSRGGWAAIVLQATW